MTLQRDVIEIPPVGGVDEAKAKFVPVAFHRLENVFPTKFGQLEKRAGLSALTTACIDSTTQPAPESVFAAGRELVSIGTIAEPASDDPGAYLYSYSESLEAWTPRAAAPALASSRYPGIRSGGGVGNAPAQVARVGSIECLAYLRDGSTDCYYRLVDRETDAVLVNDTFLGSTGKFVLFASEGLFVFLWWESGDFHQTKVDPATRIEADAVPFGGYGAIPTTGWAAIPTVAGKYVVAFIDAGGAGPGDIVIKRVDLSSAGVDAGGAIFSRAGTRVALGFVTGYAYLLVAWDDGADVRAQHFIEATLISALSDWQVVPLSIFNGGVIRTLDAEFDSAHRSFVAVGGDDLSSLPRWCVRAFSTLGASLMSRVDAYWICQQHKMFRLDGALLVTFVDSRDSYDADAVSRFGYAICNLSRHFAGLSIARPLALEGNVAPLDGVGIDRDGVAGAWPLPHVDGSAAWLAITVGPRGAGGRPDAATDAQAWADVVTLETDRRTDGLWGAAYAAELLHLTGALPLQYDGSDLHEVGFLQVPQPHGAPVLNYGSTGLEGAAGPGRTYQYVSIYEYRDGKGQVTRSRVSAAIDVVVGTSSSFTRAEVTLQFRHSALTRRASDTASGQLVRVLVYRTLQDAPGTYYQCQFDDEFNEPTSSLVTFVDTEDDAALLAAARGQLYTSGEVVENEAPPPSRHIQLSSGRLWRTSADGREVWPSKPLVAGQAPAFSSLLRITLDDAPDEVMATARLDSAQVLLTRSRIYLVPAGAGPGARGAPPWPQPEMVQSAIGCASSRSVLSYRDGVAFLSQEGLRLLTRGGDLVAIGDAVRDTLAAFPHVLDSAVDPSRMRLYWLCSSGTEAGASCVVLCLDYRYGTPESPVWSVLRTEEDQALERLALWKDRLVAAHAAGVLLEGHGTTPGWDQFGGAEVWVQAVIESPWVRLAALGGSQRVWRVVVELERQSPAGFVLDLCNDGDDAAVQSETFTPSQVGSDSRQRWLVGVRHQVCSAVKVRLTDTPPAVSDSASPSGFLYHGLSIEIGRKPGADRAEKGKTR